MTSADFKATCELALETLRKVAPYDTGNLAHDAVRIEWISSKEAWIYVDEAIAPYMSYTNEPWISPKWNGKKNPNECWFDRAAEMIAQTISKDHGGKINVKH